MVNPPANFKELRRHLGWAIPRASSMNIVAVKTNSTLARVEKLNMDTPKKLIKRNLPGLHHEEGATAVDRKPSHMMQTTA